MQTETSQDSRHSDFDNCRDLIGPHLYRRNAFRILGLPTDASLQSAIKNQKRREMEQKLGRVAAGAGADAGLLPLTPAPDGDTVRRANQSLQDPLVRFVHAFFWFWPTGGDTGPEGALSVLSGTHPAVALRSWQKFAMQAPDAVVVQHNIAVLAHTLALDCETVATHRLLSPDEEQARWAYWELAYQQWRALWSAPTFWQEVRGLRDSCDDPRLPRDIAHRLRAWLPGVIVGTTARLMVSLAVRASESGGLPSSFATAAAFFTVPTSPEGREDAGQQAPTTARTNGTTGPFDSSSITTALERHLSLLSASQWSNSDTDRFELTDQLGAVFGRDVQLPTCDLEEAVLAELQPTLQLLRQDAARVSKMTPDTPRAQLTVALGSLVRRSAIVEAFLPPESPHRAQLADAMTEALLEVAIAQANKDERWSHWLLLNYTLQDLARRSGLRQRLTAAGETLRDNAKRAEEDKALKEAEAALKANKAVDVAVGSQWTRLPLCTCCLEHTEDERPYSYSWEEQQGLQRVQRTVTLKFPLCKACAQHVRERTGRALWLVAVPTLVACAVGYLCGQVDAPNGWFVAAGATVAAVVTMLFLAPLLEYKPLAEKHACRAEPVSVRGVAGDRAIVSFSNPVYAQLFANRNGFRKEAPRPSGGYRGTSALGGATGARLLTAVLCLGLIGSGIAFSVSAERKGESPRPGVPAPTEAGTRPQPSKRFGAPTRSSPVRTDPADDDATLAREIEAGRRQVRALKEEVQDLESRLKALQLEIDQYKSEIDGYERRLRVGAWVNRTMYQATIDAHNQVVEDYNLLLSTYRSRFQDYKDQIDAVNAKVDAYNRQRRR